MYEIKIMDKLPKSGKFVELNFGKTNNLLWLLFLNLKTGEQWIGKFDFGVRGKNKVKIIKEDKVIILAKGNIYIFNCNIKSTCISLEYDNYEEFEIELIKEQIIVSDGLCIFVYDITGNLIHKTKRISLDGILMNKIENGVLYGRLNDMTSKWCNFKYILNQNKIISDWTFDN